MNRLSRVFVPVLAVGAVLALAPAAFAHARLSPSVSLANESELYSLVVPTEEANAYTTKVVLTLPKSFSIDSFVSAPGWTRVVRQNQVTWTGGRVPTDEDALFQFLGLPTKTGTFTFQVQQTYSNGKVVNWSDPETGENPAPTIKAVSSFGGGTSTLSIVAFVLGMVGILVGGVALVSRSGGRQLA